MIALLLTVALADMPDHDALDSADWKDLSTRSSDIGDVTLRRATVNDVTCIEGNATIPTTPSALLAVTDRMVTSSDWSSAALAASEELARDDTGFVLYQHFDSPGWTFSADRFWIIRGEPVIIDDSTTRYRWHRVPATEWPEAQQSSTALSSRSVEMPQNYGEWLFVQTSEGTDLRYRGCADIGGSAPTSMVTWLTTQQIPGLISDLVTEANRD